MAIKKIIAVASAKGGVGKSSLTAAIAIEKAKGFQVGFLMQISMAQINIYSSV